PRTQCRAPARRRAPQRHHASARSQGPVVGGRAAAPAGGRLLHRERGRRGLAPSVPRAPRRHGDRHGAMDPARAHLRRPGARGDARAEHGDLRAARGRYGAHRRGGALRVAALRPRRGAQWMKRRLPEPLRARLLAGLLAAALGGCGGLPSLEGRTASAAFVDTADTALGRAIAPRAAAHPGRSRVYALPGARDAFAARVLLARAAERSLDVQYYIWNDDHSGRLLMAGLRAAAERGVRVRLLLDDNNTAGL